MILVDTSVWIDHFRVADRVLADRLGSVRVLVHPFVIGELALGNLRQRHEILAALADLPRSVVATDAEVLHFVERESLFGRGIGYIDAHLLAAARLTAGTRLWTRDRRLRAVAETLGVGSAEA
ncbi:type II toxin-antitoxin system VapC family toxin [Thalassobaculum sp.]|uniref:type II toxin-antitoxin system VapC family toxin n=1 Tax=Thalassobaculum sp. TaxID=2022740 RepID=UPI0032EEBEE6